MIDFHGTTGYGQAFTDAVRGDRGESRSRISSSDFRRLSSNTRGSMG